MRATAALVPFAAIILALSGVSGDPAAGRGASLAGTPIVVEGIVAMAVEDDFASGRATRRYFLDESVSGRRYDLRLTPDQAGIVQPGMRVRVAGSLADGVLTADPGEPGVLILGVPGGAAPGTHR